MYCIAYLSEKLNFYLVSEASAAKKESQLQLLPKLIKENDFAFSSSDGGSCLRGQLQNASGEEIVEEYCVTYNTIEHNKPRCNSKLKHVLLQSSVPAGSLSYLEALTRGRHTEQQRAEVLKIY